MQGKIHTAQRHDHDIRSIPNERKEYARHDISRDPIRALAAFERSPFRLVLRSHLRMLRMQACFYRPVVSGDLMFWQTTSGYIRRSQLQ